MKNIYIFNYLTTIEANKMAKINKTDANFESTVRNLLAAGKATVTFTKKDGTVRVMNCTTNQDSVPVPVPTGDIDGVQTVYDTDINEWRSFRWDSVQSVETV